MCPVTLRARAQGTPLGRIICDGFRFFYRAADDANFLPLIAVFFLSDQIDLHNAMRLASEFYGLAALLCDAFEKSVHPPT